MNDAIVSFGLNVQKPGVLQRCRISKVFDGIKRGRWRNEVEQVRALAYRSDAQRAAKLKLPYVLGSGEFASRSNDRLIRHSGQIWIDVDDLTPKQCLRVLSRAVLDHYCLAGFHSASGHGVRLTFAVQPVPSDAATHKIAFRQVATHVEQFYAVKPDRSGNDVARASFVSHDKTMVINLSAKSLPVVLTVERLEQKSPVVLVCRTQRFLSAPEPSVGKARTFKDLGVFDLGSRFAPCRRKPDGSLFTHLSLRRLGTRLASYIFKENLSETEATVMQDEAFAGWISTVQGPERKVSREAGEYRQELSEIVRSSLKRPGMFAAAVKWTRWRQDPRYPKDAEPCFRLLFVLEQHCKDSGKRTFYISCRDAAKVAGVKSTRTSAKLLKDLIRCGYLSRSSEDGYAYAMRRFDRRKAQSYRLTHIGPGWPRTFGQKT